ncbi:MAG: hypothetical protein M1816_001060 [Peltula sp. TS41687]|nr:MAG: hypothetical protein M1816_001060 [Peltula sp. TS41687]
MSYTSPLGDRKDGSGFPDLPPAKNGPRHTRYTSAMIGNLPNAMVTHSPSVVGGDPRAGLARRFTTESTLPTFAPIGPPATQNAKTTKVQSVEKALDSPLNSTLHKIQLLEKKKKEREMLQQHRRVYEEELRQIELRQQRDEREIAGLTEELGRFPGNGGGHSEPTTPPELRESTFPPLLSYPKRWSASSSIMGPPSVRAHADSTASQFTNTSTSMGPPQSTPSRSTTTKTTPSRYNSSKNTPIKKTPSKMPSKSVPASRRNSDEKELEYSYQEDFIHRPAAALNRNSMPAVGLNFRAPEENDASSSFGLGQINTTSFLFGDEDSDKISTRKDQNSNTSDGTTGYLQIAADNKFPILVHRQDQPGFVGLRHIWSDNWPKSANDGLQLSATSAALDLALSQSPGPESRSIGSPSSSRHRPAQHSLPANSLQTAAFESSGSSGVGLPQSRVSNNDVQKKVLRFEPQSTELKMTRLTEAAQALSVGAALRGNDAQTISPPKLQSSYSANDVPTVKNTDNMIGPNVLANINTQQGNQNVNVSANPVTPTRVARNSVYGDGFIRQPVTSVLQATAPPFGFTMPSTGTSLQGLSAGTPPAIPTYWFPNYYAHQFGMPIFDTTAMNNMHLGAQFNQPEAFRLYTDYNRSADLQPWQPIQRRLADGDANRFVNAQLEDFRGEIFYLCKDQHGCRFLQKKLEEGNAEHFQIIFAETSPYVQELMTDPFGNYLCQKLIEYANNDQRTALVNNALPQLPRIALNQHGTRALQKMIDFISTPEQVQGIIRGLKDRVVQLIQDLNGNHVIQKCLNRLTPHDAQFIFDAVGANCVIVGTHRHGCCVIQRCVDHASGVQKAQLINQIANHVFPLVKDPFGNYVVQYILDLSDTSLTESVMRRFLGNVATLSKQKFSSNVIEKCIRTAGPGLRHHIIEELSQPEELGKLVRDPYANYVIQTAMDYANPTSKIKLIEGIRPHLAAIRSTPYGRRIQGKINNLEGRRSGNSSGRMTPNDTPRSGQTPLEGQHVDRPPTSGPSPATHNFFIPMSPYGNLHNGQGNSNMTAAVTTPSVNPAVPIQQVVTQLGTPHIGSAGNNNQANMQSPFVQAYGRPAHPGSGYQFY